MLLIAPGCNIVQRDIIAHGLSCVSANKKEDSIILDFSIPGTEAFWLIYKNGMKYVEDILPVLSGVNPKILREYLSPLGASMVLGLKDAKISNINIERILYLIAALETGFKYVFVIMPDEKSDNALRLIEESKYVLLPYMSDAVSAKNAILISEEYNSVLSNVNFISLKLDVGFDFHEDKILSGFEVFKNGIRSEFNFHVQEQILSPKFSYRDKSNSYVSALENVIDIYNSKTKTLNVSADRYYQNENVYKELRDNIQEVLLEEMKDYADEADSEKLKQTAKNKIIEIIKKKELSIPKNILERLYKELCDDIAGLGVLEDFLSDSSITEIMVNGPDNIFIE
ncbi:MAG: hypothetical protein LBN01_05055, partial [Endomicrobium sp.]|nr:hypothetical protein [Endomicrobium sp.]